MISEDSSEDEQPNNYSSIMNKVGDHGIYQWIIFAIITFASFVDGIVSFTLPLLYLNTQFDCSSFGVATTECEHYMC